MSRIILLGSCIKASLLVQTWVFGVGCFFFTSQSTAVIKNNKHTLTCGYSEQNYRTEQFGIIYFWVSMPFLTLAVPWTVRNPFTVTILILCSINLIPINYTNYHKAQSLSKSQSNGYYGTTAASVDLFSSSYVSLCHRVSMALELYSNAGLLSQDSALSSLFSPHLLPKRLHLHLQLHYSHR